MCTLWCFRVCQYLKITMKLSVKVTFPVTIMNNQYYTRVFDQQTSDRWPWLWTLLHFTQQPWPWTAIYVVFWRCSPELTLARGMGMGVLSDSCLTLWLSRGCCVASIQWRMGRIFRYYCFLQKVYGTMESPQHCQYLHSEQRKLVWNLESLGNTHMDSTT